MRGRRRTRDEARDDVRASADAAALYAERLAAIEREKQEPTSTDSELLTLSAEAAALGSQLKTATEAEADAARELNERPAS